MRTDRQVNFTQRSERCQQDGSEKKQKNGIPDSRPRIARTQDLSQSAERESTDLCPTPNCASES